MQTVRQLDPLHKLCAQPQSIADLAPARQSRSGSHIERAGELTAFSCWANAPTAADDIRKL
ncbi:MAG: hypothetical protein CMK72_05715 [Pseudomonadaceae bacterium]|nr:hypothetical protein [Pseudomonadaceae bacterium]HCP54281.1 hypothetical protein [Pseudomonas sp.]